jgi:HK97 family phage prohead protease
MRFYWPIAKVDGEQRMVWGYASTEALDDQGETVTRDALSAALDDYMRFANIREMHRNSAVGVAKEAEIDDKGLYLGAKIVDDDAWRKVAEGVYKGFSIGDRVTARDPSDRTIITSLTLTEISVVDRPANPEAVFDCWKLATGEPQDGELTPRDRLARMLADLDWLRQCLADQLVMEDGDAAPDDAMHMAAAIADTLRKSREHDLAPLTAGLAKLQETIVPRLDSLQKRVEDIAATPLPPQTMARAFTSIAKAEDGIAPTAGDAIVAALARMTDEERTLTLIKAAHANPITPFGS